MLGEVEEVAGGMENLLEILRTGALVFRPGLGEAGFGVADHAAQRDPQIVAERHEVHLARFDLPRGKGVVDQGEKLAAAAVDALQVGDKRVPAGLLGRLQQQFTVADDLVQRRAQRMAQLREPLVVARLERLKEGR